MIVLQSIPANNTTSSAITLPTTTSPTQKEAIRNKTAILSSQGNKEEAKESTVNPSHTVEPTPDLSATKHIKPLYHSLFKSCPFAGVFPEYDIERVFGPSNITNGYLKSNHTPTPSQVDINDIRSRVSLSYPSHYLVLLQSIQI